MNTIAKMSVHGQEGKGVGPKPDLRLQRVGREAAVHRLSASR
jgi:hypothetical protein